MNIEVEVRSYLSKEQYDRLLAFFHTNGTDHTEEYQETHYFDAPVDLRIQQSDTYSKICLKHGELNDEIREEVEVKCKKEDFGNLQKFFDKLGFAVAVKWLRTRHSFKWSDANVALDHTKGFGYILELEKITDEAGKDEALKELKQKLAVLGIPLSTKEELKVKSDYYRDHWRELIK
jgi:predicted adenylyl cyclase CyaB